MKRRRILLLLALAAVAVGFVVFWPDGPKEPVYQGRPLSKWIEDAGDSGIPGRTTERQESARKAVRAIGTNALPWLMSEFTRRDSKLRGIVSRWMPGRPKSSSYPWREYRRIVMASRGLYLLGPEAAPAFPMLAEYFGDRGQRSVAAAAAMRGAGSAALPYLLRGITSPDSATADVASAGLHYLAGESEGAIPDLIPLLDHTNRSIQIAVTDSLFRSDLRKDLTLPALIRAMSDADSYARRFDFMLVHTRDAKALPAIPGLLRLMTNSNPFVAKTASNAIFRIDPTALPGRGP